MLTSLENLKESLGIVSSSNDNLLTRLIRVSTSIIEGYCKRTFSLTEYTDEIYKGSGTQYLNLKNYPIVELTKVEENDGSYDDPSWTDITEYCIAKENEGQIYRKKGFYQREVMYRVNYSAGFDTDESGEGIPADLEQACIDIASYLYNNRSGETYKSESLGDRSYTRFENAQSPIDKLNLNTTLARYRTPTL